MPFNRHSHPGSRIPVYLFFQLAKILALAALVRLLWNYALPPLLDTRLITYWQALALLLLSRILLGSTLSPGSHAGWRKPWRTKWMQMTPEERKKFQEEWRKRWRGN